MLDAGRLDDLADYLGAGVDLLVCAGADFGFIAANTPHLVFDKVQRESAVPPQLGRHRRFEETASQKDSTLSPMQQGQRLALSGD